MVTTSVKSNIALSIVAIFVLTACTGQGTLDNVKYKNNVLEQREIKDSFFKKSVESPLLEEQQWKFTRLQYFPVKLLFRINAQAKPLADQTAIPMKTSTGHERLYFPRLFLEFEFEGVRLHLTAYQEVNSAEQSRMTYFVPFTDLTSGNETYGAGRYLEFDYAGSGLAQLDFNLTYNPYCAYNYNYSCPIPPIDNNLTLAVKAGEMVFKD